MLRIDDIKKTVLIRCKQMKLNSEVLKILQKFERLGYEIKWEIL